MKNKRLQVGTLLKKYNLFEERFQTLDYHLRVLSLRAVNFVSFILGLSDLSEEELAYKVYELIDKADSESPNFDSTIYTSVARYGNRSLDYFGGDNHNIWDNGLFEDDGFGMSDNYADKFSKSVERHYENNGPKLIKIKD